MRLKFTSHERTNRLITSILIALGIMALIIFVCFSLIYFVIPYIIPWFLQSIYHIFLGLLIMFTAVIYWMRGM